MDDAPAAFLCAEHGSVRSDGDAVGAPGDFSEHIRHPGPRIKAQDALLLHHADEHRASVPRQPAGPPLVRAGNEIEFPSHVSNLS